MKTELSTNNAERKARILVLAPTYTPAIVGAGPVRSIEGIVHHLHKEFDFKIITRDRDFGDAAPFATVRVDDWQQVGEADVFYASPASLAPRALRRLLNGLDYDLLYLNSFFLPGLSILPLVLRRFGLIKKRPVILASHGEFSPGAIGLKHTKKRCFLLMAKLLGLHKNIVWHATSELEAEDIRKWFPPLRTVGHNSDRMLVAEYLRVAVDSNEAVASKIEPQRSEKKKGSLKIVFLSRISPKKNLDYALKLLSRLTGKVTFDIYGPVDAVKDGAYWLQCQRLMEEMPKTVAVTYKGVVEPSSVLGVFSKYDIFLLPTLGENFGHVFAEALFIGCPILVSDQTPWRNLKEKHAGWDLPLEQPDAFVEVLEKLLDMDAGEYAELSEGARRLGRLALATMNSTEKIQQSRELFSYGVLLSARNRDGGIISGSEC